ncbi:hypothetical protein STVIR_2054 [Streptomyces viridochromogenes Tue57]|uniref:Uncharacterized protein n=1 Tax=Streptomyces viridochromogenes Tue57 TaxID=1160705 RepID=L8PKQ3_STRVR|nr:hypothetical protein STVIR_2054 [Streptomyces viridochromogenes Tue57]
MRPRPGLLQEHLEECGRGFVLSGPSGARLPVLDVAVMVEGVTVPDAL